MKLSLIFFHIFLWFSFGSRGQIKTMTIAIITIATVLLLFLNHYLGYDFTCLLSTIQYK